MRGALAVVLLCTLAETAAAEPQRVVFVSTPAAIVEASRTALDTWGVTVEAIDAESPGDRMPAAERAASALASVQGAAVVVWLTGDATDGALWIYDARVQQVVTRRIEHPANIDEPTAAGLALSVKTLLRHSQVAPEVERVIRIETAPASPVPSPSPPTASERPGWWISPRAGVSWRSIEGDDVGLRVGLDVDVRGRARCAGVVTSRPDRIWRWTILASTVT
jgi:hypothetical protein